MQSYSSILNRFLTWSAKTAGKPLTFVLALAFLIVWVLIGIIWGFDTRWWLVIDTFATINASLMVFIIQNTQIRENKALHIKLDGIITGIKETEKQLIAIEELEEDELEKIRKNLIQQKK